MAPIKAVIDLKPGYPPTEPKIIKTVFEGKFVDAEVWNVREQAGNQEYILLRAPHAREFTRVSLFKGQLTPINNDEMPNWMRNWFK